VDSRCSFNHGVLALFFLLWKPLCRHFLRLSILTHHACIENTKSVWLKEVKHGKIFALLRAPTGGVAWMHAAILLACIATGTHVSSNGASSLASAPGKLEVPQHMSRRE